jgi:hypothetical protein
LLVEALTTKVFAGIGKALAYADSIATNPKISVGGIGIVPDITDNIIKIVNNFFNIKSNPKNF